MKNLKLTGLSMIAIFVFLACNDTPKTRDPKNQKCLSAFELNERNNTINKMYCNQKEGRWITKTWNDKKDRVATEEGYYKNNQKEGYWKFYNIDGTLKDSVFFIKEFVF